MSNLSGHLRIGAFLKILAFLLAFITSFKGPGQDTGNSQPWPLAGEYHKFDDLVSLIRKRNQAQYAIDPARGIDEEQFVEIGGIEQWVKTRGRERSNPVLLFLHGGPGDVTSCWSFGIFAPWEEHFTVVQWDERGAGRTLKKNGPRIGPTLTVDRIAQDGIELTEYLRRHLRKDKIILVGHSFGSVLGLEMVEKRPDLFYAYVGTGQVADETRNYAVAYYALLKKARALGDQRAIDELSKAGPPPYPDGKGYRAQWRWANAFEGADQFLAGTLGLALVAPGCSVADINASGDGEVFSAEHLVRQTAPKGPKEFGLNFSIPMFFFQGAEDFTSPTELARQYMAAIHAPRKAFVEIKGGGHFAVFMRSGEFLNQLVKRVRPLTGGS